VCSECGHPHNTSDIFPVLYEQTFDQNQTQNKNQQQHHQEQPSLVLLKADFYCKECGCPTFEPITPKMQQDLEARLEKTLQQINGGSSS